MRTGFAWTVGAVALALGAVAPPARAASAANTDAAAVASPSVHVAQGTAGACPTAEGVTVVVDFQGLGRDTIVRCAPGSPSSGFDALTRAGISFKQVESNPGFMCKIEGMPASDSYAAGCTRIPPTSAYWGYWVAPRGGAWCYSNVGANRTPPPGTVEGWSFSSGNSEAGAPPPRTSPPPHVAGAPTSVSKATCPSPPTTVTTTTTTTPVPTTARPATGGAAPGTPNSAPGSDRPGSQPSTTATSGSPGASAPSDGDAAGVGDDRGPGDDAPADTATPDDPAAPTEASRSSSATEARAGGDLLIGEEDDDPGSPAGIALGLGGAAVIGTAAVVTARRQRRITEP